MTNRTPFFHHHQSHGGKIIDFFGWELPVQYTTISLEHNAVRTGAGLFDISHMGQVYLWGRDSLAFLQYLLSNNIEKAGVGKGIYAHMLNERGGVIDDLYVFHLEADKYLIIVNASRREADYAWIKSHVGEYDVDFLEAPASAGLALQGPKAVQIIDKLCPSAARLSRNQIGEFEFGDVTTLVARTGYTGEDGFEFFAPAGHLLQIWDQLLEAGKTAGLALCGLGARDTLRTEVSYPLYGHELDENHTPLEAGLDWVVKFDKGNFVGRDALIKQKSNGLPTRLCGFKVESGGVARPDGQIFSESASIGTVASGTFSPTLGVSIGMAYLPAAFTQEGKPLTIRQGAREMTAVSAKLPFLSKPILAAKP